MSRCQRSQSGAQIESRSSGASVGICLKIVDSEGRPWQFYRSNICQRQIGEITLPCHITNSQISITSYDPGPVTKLGPRRSQRNSNNTVKRVLRWDARQRRHAKLGARLPNCGDSSAFAGPGNPFKLQMWDAWRFWKEKVQSNAIRKDA